MSKINSNLKIIVVGGGPGGLTFALQARSNGAEVTLIEFASDPRAIKQKYNDRSFNLTLNSVGRSILPNEVFEDDGAEVLGRAIHNFKGTNRVHYADFETVQDGSHRLTSIPRSVLRENMVEACDAKGVIFEFDSKVAHIDFDAGSIRYEKSEKLYELDADLVVVCDGIQSIADSRITKELGGTLGLSVDPLRYVTVQLDRAMASGLKLSHNHFWREAGRSSIAIGLPNKEGSISVLLVSSYNDTPPGKSPFESSAKAHALLKAEFPMLLKLDSGLAQRLIGKRAGNFYYKSVSTSTLGSKAILLGDASSASPPWAGFGANTAIYCADAFSRYLFGLNGEVEQAINDFQEHRVKVADLVLMHARVHGEFLNTKVSSNPTSRPIGPILGQIMKQAIADTEVPSGVSLLTL